MASNVCIVTLVTSDDFVIGAQVMVHSLKQNNPEIQSSFNDHSNLIIAVMVTNNISTESRCLLLSSGFDQIIEVDSIPNPNCSVHVESWIDVGFTKLRIWSLTQFDKVLYIDADCLVLDEITDLLNDPLYSNITFAAAPDVFPPDNFNAGVMLITPSMNTFNALLSEMAYIHSYDGGDTGFLNGCSLFRDWFQSQKNEDIMRLHFGYNAQRIMHWFTRKRPEYWSSMESKLKILHFSSSPKPWTLTPSQRVVDRVDIQWHKYWISLNQSLNLRHDQSVILNECNHIIHKTATKMELNFDFNSMDFANSHSFDCLMTRRHIEFGRISGDVEQEKSFLMECKRRFSAFTKRDHDENGSESTKSITSRTESESAEFIMDGIPKMIHQIWIGPNPVPPQYLLWSASWKEMNPDWKYMLWTDDSLNESKFKWHSMANKSLFEMAKNYGEKSDILRLEVLYQFGGIYVDMDFECIQPLNKLDLCSSSSSYSFIAGFSNTGLLEVNNAMIGCTPKHRALVDIWNSIQLICNDDGRGDIKRMNTIVRTGPIQMTRAIMRLYGKYKDILIFPIQCFYPLPNNMRYLPVVDRFRYYDDATLAVHHWGVSWNEKQRNKIVAMGKENESEMKEDSASNEKEIKAIVESRNSVNSSKGSILDAVMNDSSNLVLQSKIMSFLH